MSKQIPKGAEKFVNDNLPFSPIVEVKGILYTPGTLGDIDPFTKTVKSKSISHQTRQILQKTQDLMENCDFSMDDIFKVKIFMAVDLKANYNAVNQVYVKFFNKPLPVRTCVEVVSLPYEAKIEMEFMATR